MNNYMLPVDDDFVEVVARAIAKNRLYHDASDAMENMIGVSIESSEKLEESFGHIFDRLWSGSNPADERQKNMYREDAKAAIAAINLKLLTSPE